jgi:hypothetical protein
MRLRAFALNCTLKASPEPSSVERLLDDLFGELRGLGVDCEQVRAADHDIRPRTAPTAAPAVNATHLARVLREHPYPQQPGA